MIKQPIRYLAWLLLAILPVAAYSQGRIKRRDHNPVVTQTATKASETKQRTAMQDAGILPSRAVQKTTTVQPALPETLQPGQMVVARQDTMVMTKRDTVVVVKVDTAYVVKYDTLSADMLDKQQQEVVYTSGVPDSVLERVVTKAMMRVMRVQGYSSDYFTDDEEENKRTRAEQLWDRSQAKRKIKHIDRALLKAVFIPKGEWLLGGTFNYQEWDTDNINLLVLKDIDIEGHTFTGSPYFGYFVANNIAIGGRYSYSRHYFYLGNFNLNLGEDFNISLEDLYYLEHTHEGTVFMRTYMPLGRSKMFGFFNDIQLTYAHTVGKNSTGSGADYDGSYGKTHALKLSFCPGMTAFVTDFMAAEASIGIMGFKYKWQEQQTNRIESGKSRSTGANFRFNLLSINLGITFYL